MKFIIGVLDFGMNTCIICSSIVETMNKQHTVPQESHDAKKQLQEANKSTSEKKRQKVFIRLFEVLTLTPAILIIIGLFTLPTVFYALPSVNTAAVSSNEVHDSRTTHKLFQICKVN